LPPLSGRDAAQLTGADLKRKRTETTGEKIRTPLTARTLVFFSWGGSFCRNPRHPGSTFLIILGPAGGFIVIPFRCKAGFFCGV